MLSFVGFAPADEPRFVMLVMLDEPKNEKWGSEAAAPIFAAIGREVLRYLDVPPRDATPVQIVTGPARPMAGRVRPRDRGRAGGRRRLMPDLRGQTLRQALAALAPLRRARWRWRVAGRRAPDQTPAPGDARWRAERSSVAASPSGRRPRAR